MWLKIFKKKILKEIEDELGYCSCWEDSDIITVKKKTGHATGMTVETFKKNLFKSNKILIEEKIKGLNEKYMKIEKKYLEKLLQRAKSVEEQLTEVEIRWMDLKLYSKLKALLDYISALEFIIKTKQLLTKTKTYEKQNQTNSAYLRCFMSRRK